MKTPVHFTKSQDEIMREGRIRAGEKARRTNEAAARAKRMTVTLGELPWERRERERREREENDSCD